MWDLPCDCQNKSLLTSFVYSFPCINIRHKGHEHLTIYFVATSICILLQDFCAKVVKDNHGETQEDPRSGQVKRRKNVHDIVSRKKVEELLDEEIVLLDGNAKFSEQKEYMQYGNKRCPSPAGEHKIWTDADISNVAPIAVIGDKFDGESIVHDGKLLCFQHKLSKRLH